MDPQDTTPQDPETVDPRATVTKDLLVGLLNSAQGIWKDALDSQIRLATLADDLQESINEIKQLTSLPNYPAGLQLLQLCIVRITNSRKRLNTVHARLDNLENIIKQRPKPQEPETPTENTEGSPTESSPPNENTQAETAETPDQVLPSEPTEPSETDQNPPAEAQVATTESQDTEIIAE